MTSNTPLRSIRSSIKIPQTPITIPASPFLQRLGYGTGINVWKFDRSPKCNLPRSPWAIKKLRSKMAPEQVENIGGLLKNEANVLKDLHHENIVGFRGYLKNKDGSDCLVMENCDISLGDMIQQRYENDLEPYAVVNIKKVAFDVASALKYLHEEKSMVHGDIKSFNVLIKGDFEEVKLCDFGVSSKFDQNGVVEKYVGTAVYNAPECQDDSYSPVTYKADIFSYGLVLWEMMSLTPPHTDMSVLSEESYLEEDSIMEEQLFGTRPPLPDVNLEAYKDIIELFFWCTEADPCKRPRASEILQFLENKNTLTS